MRVLLLRNSSCDRRENEEYKIRKWLIDNGHIETANEPDLTILTACSYTQEHKDTVQRHIDKIPGLIVTGCWPNAVNIDEYLGIKNITNYHRGVWISQGCLGNCSFCTCCHTRLRSRDPSMILHDVQSQWEHGTLPLLLGLDTGTYGLDRSTSLPSLLRLLYRNKQGQIQLDCMGAHWFLKYYDVMQEYLGKFINRVAIGVQTFNRTLLQRLGRPDYDTIELARKIQDLAAIHGGDIFDIRLITWVDETDSEYAFDRKIVHTYLFGVPFHVRCFGREAKDFYKDMSWLCEKCGMKKYDCICTFNRKGKTLW